MIDIQLPHPRYCLMRENRRIRFLSKCLTNLSSHKITVQWDNGRLGKLVSEKPKKHFMNDSNGTYSSFFSINDTLFMIVDCDLPEYNYENWVSYYVNNGVKAFFICSLRPKFKSILDQMGVNAFPLGTMTREYKIIGTFLAIAPKDYPAKDISISFQGEFHHHPERLELCKKIYGIPNAYINATKDKELTASEYVHTMLRSRIVWSPKSIHCSDGVSTVSSRDQEAMCMKVPIIRSHVEIIEQHPRIGGVHFIEVKKDNSDFIEVLDKHLNDTFLLQQIADNAYEYYCKYWDQPARAQYIFEKCLSVM